MPQDESYIVPSPEPLSKEERNAYLEMVNKEFGPRDGYYDFSSGFLLILWALTGWSFLTNGWILHTGYTLYFPFLLVVMAIGWVRLSAIRRKYPDIKRKDMTSDAMNRHEIIIVPVAFGVFMMAVVLHQANIPLPNKLGYHLVMFLAYATLGPTFLCSLALKYSSMRYAIWTIMSAMICLTMVFYPNDWTRLYLKGGGLGVLMLITGLILHLRFVRTLPPKQRKG